jgi:hypothetical protein
VIWLLTYIRRTAVMMVGLLVSIYFVPSVALACEGAASEFKLPYGGPAGATNSETPLGFKIRGTAEAEVTCGALMGSASVMELPGKTGERASEDAPASTVTEKARQLGVAIEDESCKATISGVEKEATVTPSSCQLELQEHSGENVYLSLRASVAGSPCALTIKAGECEIKLAAESRGENEKLEGIKVKTISSEELEIKESSAMRLRAKENGKCGLGANPESTLEIKRGLLAVQEVLVNGSLNFGQVQEGRRLSRRIGLVAGSVTPTFEVLNISGGENTFKRRVDRCSNQFVGRECELEIEFAPTARVPYTAILEAPFRWRFNNMTLQTTTFRPRLSGEGV